MRCYAEQRLVTEDGDFSRSRVLVELFSLPPPAPNFSFATGEIARGSAFIRRNNAPRTQHAFVIAFRYISGLRKKREKSVTARLRMRSPGFSRGWHAQVPIVSRIFYAAVANYSRDAWHNKQALGFHRAQKVICIYFDTVIHGPRVGGREGESNAEIAVKRDRFIKFLREFFDPRSNPLRVSDSRSLIDKRDNSSFWSRQWTFLQPLSLSLFFNIRTTWLLQYSIPSREAFAVSSVLETSSHSGASRRGRCMFEEVDLANVSRRRSS